VYVPCTVYSLCMYRALSTIYVCTVHCLQFMYVPCTVYSLCMYRALSTVYVCTVHCLQFMYVLCTVYSLLFRTTNTQYLSSNVYFVKYYDMFRFIFIIFREFFYCRAKVTKSIKFKYKHINLFKFLVCKINKIDKIKI